MGLSFIPLFGANATETIAQKPFVALTGQALVDADELSKQDILSFIKSFNTTFNSISLKINDSTKFTNEDLIELLNNGITALFIIDNNTYASEVGNSINISKERLITSTSLKIIPASQLTAETFYNELLSQLKTDRKDDLYTTLVVDTNERSLGLVYSSKESIKLAIEKSQGVYYSRSRKGIWIKGETSGNRQILKQISIDCDGDALQFVVEQVNDAFCHLNTNTCFGDYQYGLLELQKVLSQRLVDAEVGSYTKRLFNDDELLNAKIKEEAEELTEAQTKDEVAWEAADLFYFAMTKLVSKGVTLKDVETNLKLKHLKVTRRKGDAKEKFLPKKQAETETSKKEIDPSAPIYLNVVKSTDKEGVIKAVTRPIQKTDDIMHLVNPIIENVKNKGDSALIEYTAKFDGVHLTTPVLEAPFPEEYLEGLTEEMKQASFRFIH